MRRARSSSGLDVMLTGPRRLYDGDARHRGLRLGGSSSPAGPLLRHGRALVPSSARLPSAAPRWRRPKGDRRFVDPAWGSNPLLHRLCPGVPGRRRQPRPAAGATWTSTGVTQAGALRRRERRRRARTEQQPAAEPGGAQGGIDTGGSNLLDGGAQLMQDVARRRTPAMVDDLAFQVGKDLALTPGAVVLPHAAGRADPVPPADRAVREVPLMIVPADDQQVLRRRPRAGPQHDRALRPVRPAGVRHELAQPGRGATPLGARRLRRRGPESLDAASDHRVIARARARLCAGGITSAVALVAPRRHRAPRPRRRADARRHRAGPAAGRHARRVRRRARRGRGHRRVGSEGLPRRPGARAVSSPGCGPTTWSGTTGSTTTCWARSRQPSTCCSGTPTPRACRPRCTATSCG